MNLHHFIRNRNNPIRGLVGKMELSMWMLGILDSSVTYNNPLTMGPSKYLQLAPYSIKNEFNGP